VIEKSKTPTLIGIIGRIWNCSNGLDKKNIFENLIINRLKN
jgi:hypothetical protein